MPEMKSLWEEFLFPIYRYTGAQNFQIKGTTRYYYPFKVVIGTSRL